MPRSEVDLLLAVQRHASPAALRLARGLSLAGEHAAAWTALGLVGVAADRSRRGDWLWATGTVLAAHASSVVLKRVVRRTRPEHPELAHHVGVASRWSFPSSHATSTTAAAIVFARLTGSRLPYAAVPLMAWSRLAAGVHHPSDVAVGSALGAAVAVAAGRR